VEIVMTLKSESDREQVWQIQGTKGVTVGYQIRRVNGEVLNVAPDGVSPLDLVAEDLTPTAPKRRRLLRRRQRS
jgi:hypothetical protein